MPTTYSLGFPLPARVVGGVGPFNLSALVGQSLFVSASTGSPPVSYQWQLAADDFPALAAVTAAQVAAYLNLLASVDSCPVTWYATSTGRVGVKTSSAGSAVVLGLSVFGVGGLLGALGLPEGAFTGMGTAIYRPVLVGGRPGLLPQ